MLPKEALSESLQASDWQLLNRMQKVIKDWSHYEKIEAASRMVFVAKLKTRFIDDFSIAFIS